MFTIKSSHTPLQSTIHDSREFYLTEMFFMTSSVIDNQIGLPDLAAIQSTRGHIIDRRDNGFHQRDILSFFLRRYFLLHIALRFTFPLSYLWLSLTRLRFCAERCDLPQKHNSSIKFNFSAVLKEVALTLRVIHLLINSRIILHVASISSSADIDAAQYLFPSDF